MKKLIILVFASFLLLTACKNYNVQVDLTPEEKQATLQEIEQLKQSIANYVPENGEIAWRDMISLALAYEKLGDMDNAIKVYTDVLDNGDKTKAIINNLGRLYETVGEYDLAIIQYQRIVDEYLDESYFYDITWANIRAAQNSKGDEAVSYRKQAEKVFNVWQMAAKKTDEQTQQAIKDLREKEKANQ